MSEPAPPARARVRDVFLVFLRLGFIGFGGPAAHVAMMREQVVDRRKWIDDQHFMDMLGATNLIPGPNSSEMTMHIGYVVAGWRGLLAGGLGFSLPAILMVIALAVLYTRFGSTPAVGFLLEGIKPVIIPIIAAALIKLTPKAVTGLLTGGVAAAALALYFLGVDNILLLLAGGLIVLVTANLRRRASAPPAENAEAPGKPRSILLAPLAGLPAALASAMVPFSFLAMFLTFLKIGAVLYGSGYTLFAFLQADFVTRLGWLDESMLIDAIAVGQLTPGPIVTAATFLGYVMGAQQGGWLSGLFGALLATAGIYIPSYLAVAISNPLIPRIRASRWAGALLDGVNAAALGLMAAVTVQLALAAYTGPVHVAIGAAAAVALFAFNVPSIWLILGGAAAGALLALIG